MLKIINISKHRFESLKPLILDKTIYNTEGKLYFLPMKTRWKTDMKLLKKMYIDSDNRFGNKMYTINSLISHRNELDIQELVIPETLGVVKGQIVGPILPYIEGTNLQIILNDPYIQIADKRKFIVEVGSILDKLSNIRKYTKLKDFYLNDLHEGNFIVGKHDNVVRAIDLDSCGIANNQAFPARYLGENNPISNLPNKYPSASNYSSGLYIPSEETDLYCYNIMILNFLFQGNVNSMNLDEFYNYLDYLNSIGINSELIDIFASIYENKPNANPGKVLENISSKQIVKASKLFYYK